MLKDKKAKPKPVMDMVKVLVPVIVVVVTSLITFAGFIYWNHVVKPKLKCNITSPEQDRYTESTSYRSMKLVARPQIVVRYGKCVVASVYLEEYYENEHIIFSAGAGIATKTGKDRTDALLLYIKEGVLACLAQSHNELSTREIAANLFVYISILGGVTYTNERGNIDRKFCITQEDGSVLDYGANDEVIRRRLREYQIKLPADPAGMAQDDRIKTLIQSSAEHIGSHCLKNLKHIQIPLYVAWIIVVGGALYAMYQVYHWHRKIIKRAKALLQKLCGMDWLQRLALTGGALVITVPLAWCTANAVTATRDERLTYAELSIAEQLPTDVLFAPEQPKMPDNPSKLPEEREPAVGERLHLLDEFLGSDISDAMLEYYGNLFSNVYRDGTEGTPVEAVLPTWFHLDREPYTHLAQRTREIIGEEEGKCSYSRRPANLYHLGRVLTDTVLTDTELRSILDFEDLLYIAADGVACGESFLTYADHSIGESAGDVRNAEDIALRNGKVYWALANILETEDGFQAYREYAPCLWAAGFKCVEQGWSLTTAEDPDYAMMTYYLGNFGERMLAYIPPQEEPDSLYHITGTAALNYYEEARKLLEQGGNSYNSEANMNANIRSGINTLNGKGFHFSPDTP